MRRLEPSPAPSSRCRCRFCHRSHCHFSLVSLSPSLTHIIKFLLSTLPCTPTCTQTKACPCFAADRECDPDLCVQCGLFASTTTACANCALQTRRHQRLKVGHSTVPQAGWGLFTMDYVAKEGLLTEYLGTVLAWCGALPCAARQVHINL